MMPAKIVRYVLCLATLALVGCRNDDVDFGEAPSAGSASGGNSAGGASSGGAGTGSTAGKTSHGGSTEGGKSSAGSAGKPDGGSAAAGKGGGGMAHEGCDTPPSAAPEMKWINATGNLAKLPSECGNLGLVSAQPCSNRVIAGVAQKGLWQTLDSGKTWTELGQGASSEAITNRVSAIVYDPRDPKTFWESGIYNGGGLYRTRDGGQSFEQLGDVSHCDSISVDFSDPERKTLLAGSHETNSKLHLSKDGGSTWSDVAAGLPDGQCTATAVLDATTFLVGCNAGTLSIVRSENSGAQWSPLPGTQLGGIFQPLIASDGTIYWPGGAGGVSVSVDQGQSFDQKASPAEAPGLVAPAQFAELPDGRVVIVGKDHLLATGDQGASWKPLGEELPFEGGGYNGARGVTYSSQTKTFFIWRWDCGDAVPENAIMSMGFDWEAP
jgi:hypothetical protein